MKAELAKQLLANVMDWSPEDTAKELPVIQALANYKYDGYQQFSAGMHFMESLAVWLNKLKLEDRKTAYNFVKNKLIFISEAEMRHLVGLSYHDKIRRVLLTKAACEEEIPIYATREDSGVGCI